MATKVYTESICEKCGKIEHRDGAEGGFPPVGWAEFTLVYREEGSGWTNNRRVALTLCPKCADKVAAAT